MLFQPTGFDALQKKEQGVIERVEPRRGTLSRMSQGSQHLIAANVDQALIVASAADPPERSRWAPAEEARWSTEHTSPLGARTVRAGLRSVT